jgi:hypothetical protein
MNQDTRTPESATSTDEGYKRRDFLKITSTVAQALAWPRSA